MLSAWNWKLHWFANINGNFISTDIFFKYREKEMEENEAQRQIDKAFV